MRRSVADASRLWSNDAKQLVRFEVLLHDWTDVMIIQSSVFERAQDFMIIRESVRWRPDGDGLPADGSPFVWLRRRPVSIWDIIKLFIKLNYNFNWKLQRLYRLADWHRCLVLAHRQASKKFSICCNQYDHTGAQKILVFFSWARQTFNVVVGGGAYHDQLHNPFRFNNATRK